MKKEVQSKSLNLLKSILGRSDRIRTYDPLVPNQMRYQTALRSDKPCILTFTGPSKVRWALFILFLVRQGGALKAPARHAEKAIGFVPRSVVAAGISYRG